MYRFSLSHYFEDTGSNSIFEAHFYPEDQNRIASSFPILRAYRTDHDGEILWDIAYYDAQDNEIYEDILDYSTASEEEIFQASVVQEHPMQFDFIVLAQRFFYDSVLYSPDYTAFSSKKVIQLTEEGYNKYMRTPREKDKE